MIDADIIGIVEAPNTKANGAQSTVTKLETFAAFAGLGASRAMTGLLSSGIQEIAVNATSAKKAQEEMDGAIRIHPWRRS